MMESQLDGPGVVCGRRVLAALPGGGAFIAQEEGGRRVVLKKLEADCLLGGKLHPSIRERLERVRELAHVRVANLLGVEREESGVYLVWDFVEGVEYEKYVTEHEEVEVRRVGREVTLAVEGMHLRGIVHGGIHGRNVFIGADGAVRITHVSPLLYSDPADDVAAVGEMVGVSGGSLAEVRKGLLGTELPEAAGGEGGRTFRKKTMVGAVCAAGVGVGVAMGFAFASRHGERGAVPQRAPAAAMVASTQGAGGGR